MLTDDMLTRPCTITQRTESGTTDRRGNAVKDETTVDTVCELQQDDHAEQTAGGIVAPSTWTLILPAGTEIAVDDSVTVDGRIYEVRGEPWQARDPATGAVDHIEATVVITTGANEGGS